MADKCFGQIKISISLWQIPVTVIVKVPKNLEESHVLFCMKLLFFWKTTVCLPLSPANHRIPGNLESQLTIMTLEFSVLPSPKTGCKRCPHNQGEVFVLETHIRKILKEKIEKEHCLLFQWGYISHAAISPSPHFMGLYCSWEVPCD